SYKETVTEPDCIHMGYTTHTCEVCGDSYKDNYVDAKGHECEVKVVAATCTEYGYTENACKHCDYSYISEITQPVGHKGEVQNAKAATCTEEGYTGDVICSVCGELQAEGQVIPVDMETCASKLYTDVDQNQWYHEAIDYVVSNNLMTGVGNNQFRPNDMLTRGQIVAVLYRMEGSPEVTGTVPFTDVADGEYYTNAVIWAYQNGIVKGVSDTAFAPSVAVNREQMVTFLARYAKLTGVEVTAKGDLSKYPDGTQVSSFAVESMVWAVENGIINGIGNELAPKDFSTRAQFATVIMRLKTANQA
ncbi:MAG: S-layer homology domain-containing protein, partial [Faecousia sp.]